LKRLALTLVLSASLLVLGTVARAQESAPVAPDNSAVNVRDRSPAAMTSGEQSNVKSDVELTREIRRAVVKDPALSTLAHNVKIVAVNGSVTLRGPVKTEEERTAIASKAQEIAGADKVDNQLEVKGQQ
jgi:hyperosmotically inducible periplasmic protein